MLTLQPKLDCARRACLEPEQAVPHPKQTEQEVGSQECLANCLVPQCAKLHNKILCGALHAYGSHCLKLRCTLCYA